MVKSIHLPWKNMIYSFVPDFFLRICVNGLELFLFSDVINRLLFFCLDGKDYCSLIYVFGCFQIESYICDSKIAMNNYCWYQKKIE